MEEVEEVEEVEELENLGVYLILLYAELVE